MRTVILSIWRGTVSALLGWVEHRVTPGRSAKFRETLCPIPSGASKENRARAGQANTMGNAIGQGVSLCDHSRTYALDQLSQQNRYGRHPIPKSALDQATASLDQVHQQLRPLG